MRHVLVLLSVAVLLGGCQSSPEPDAEVVLGDLVIAAPDHLPAGTVVLGVTNADSAHHDLSICPGTAAGCTDDLVLQRVLAKPELARDPDALPDETLHLVLGGEYRSVVEVDLEPGTYRFYCAVINHAPRGMVTEVEVG